MNPRPPAHDRPLSTVELLTPNSDDDLELVLKRKHSLDHGEYSSPRWRPPQLDNNVAEVADNAISLPRQKSLESIGCRRDESGPSRDVGRRPRSWLSTAKYPEDARRIRRRRTDPLAKDFRSDYEEALSSLLWQPYECRTEVNTSLDDSDVSYWLNGNKRWKGSSESSSRSSLSSSSSSDYVRRPKESKTWSREESSSSIRGLLKVSPSRIGNVEGISDLDSVAACSPLGALPATGREASQCETRCECDMLVNVVENAEPSVSATSEGVSVVSCYRAVPSVACNVSNVRIVQNSDVRVGTTPRTFTSTEAQTDDVVVNVNNREQRRRERRERRHQRRLNSAEWQTQVMSEPLADRLPDILNSHLPPPYTTLPIGLPPPPPPAVPVLPPPIAVTAAGAPSPTAGGLRFPFAIVPPGRRR